MIWILEGMDRRAELTEFLKSRRARVQPEELGIKVYGGRRRVPGLRREELAQAAGVSADYYVRLEQGRTDNVSQEILDAVADGRLDDWTRMIDTNLTGVLRLVRAFTPDLIAAAGTGRTADLVNISSIGAHVVFPGYAVYGATKAALTHLSASLRADLAPYDVRVTNIEPGLTDTELATHLDAPGQDLIASMNEQIGPLHADDIADVVTFAVSRRRELNLRQIVALPTRQA